MNEQQFSGQGGTTPPFPPRKKRGHGCVTVLLVCIVASFAIVGGFLLYAMLTPPIEYKTLDYDAVMRTPNIFKNEYSIVEGTLMQILPVSPDVTSKDVYLQVRERGNDEHIWLVYGPMSADDVLRLQEGMNITARGSFVGVFPITNMIGEEINRPAVYSMDFDFGYKIGGENHD